MQKNVKKMTLNYSPNFDHKKRDKKKIKYLIYHYTGMKNDKLAIKKLTSLYSNVSCHYYITKSGKLIQMVPDLFVAWHAGESYWGNDKSINYNSIGIEISNPGHGNGYRNFSDKQIKCLIRISKLIIKKYNIDKNKILGHSDIAPLRKIDPGEKFPWKFLNKKKIGVWHNVSSEKLKSLRKKNSEENSSEFINYLKKIGYNIGYSNLNELKKIIKVFQMRFRPELVNGKLDLECLNIAKSLNNIK
ncbi:N-acetylmuramoyl-L-alanine amidase [Pelagibacterales bacterium SAG-MED16]|nr:N-acetylmuramoyl-L-alanine amidase [Pelagibacterales bacterium SAG-MED16]